MPTANPTTPPPEKPPYPIPLHALATLVLTLPRPAPEAPDTAWQAAVQDSLDKLTALDPRDAIEAMLAIDLIALNAAQRDALRLAVEPAATADQARLQRASAVALHRRQNASCAQQRLATREPPPAHLRGARRQPRPADAWPTIPPRRSPPSSASRPSRRTAPATNAGLPPRQQKASCAQQRLAS